MSDQGIAGAAVGVEGRCGVIYNRTLMTEAERRPGDGLVLDNGEKVLITANSHEVHIGCVTVTWAAWEKLVEIVAKARP